MDTSSKKRKLWDVSNMQPAIESIQNGMSFGVASQTFGIPKTTLYNRINAGFGTIKAGRKSALSSEEERQLGNYLLFMANAGTPVTQRAAINTATRLAAHRYVEESFLHGNCYI